MLDAAAREQITKKNLANVLAKLQSGGTLTARELALVAGASGESGYCSNLDELGAELGVDRRTLANAKKRFGKDYAEKKHILERADGRYHIASWREFLDAHAVAGRGKADDLEDERALRLEATRLDLRRKRIQLDKEEDLLLAVAQFEAALGQTVSSFNAAVTALPGRAALKILPRVRTAVLNALRGRLPAKVFAKVDEALTGAEVIDFADVEEVLAAEVDLVKRTLSACDYLQVDEDLD